MMDPIGLLGDTKKKVVILRAIEFRTESADFLDNVASHRRQMTDVIVGEKEVGRPVWLKQRRPKAIFSQFVFVRINYFGFAMCLQKLGKLKKRVRFEQIVMIQKADPFAPSQCEPVV